MLLLDLQLILGMWKRGVAGWMSKRLEKRMTDDLSHTRLFAGGLR